MTRFRFLLSRILTVFRRSRLESDMDEEIRSHLEMAADDHRRHGMTFPQAREAALRNFGGVDQVKERYRDHYHFQGFESLLQDVRFALRTLRNSPGFTVVVVMTIALGVGINTAVFTVTNAALFQGFPLVPQNDRIQYITNKSVPYPDFEDWRRQAKSFAGMAAVQGLFKFVSGSSDAPEVYSGTRVTVNAFQVLGVKPKIGRDFTRSDADTGAAPVVMLSDDVWQRAFAENPEAIGRKIELNGVPTVVIGVMPAGFSFPQKQDLWLPIVPTSEVLRRDRPFLWFAFGRLADGATIESVRAEMEAIGHRLQNDYPRTYQGIPVLKNFNDMFIGASATVLYKAMWVAVGFVLLIVCANVANLLLARAGGRSKELFIRVAIGAGRWRLIRQLLVESVLLSSLGGVFGWWIAKIGVRLYVLMQRSDSWFAEVLGTAMDYRVFVYFTAISLGTGLLFGVAPALRLSKFDISRALKGAAAGATRGKEGKRLSALLISVQVALAVVLLTGAGVMIRSFLNIYNANVGVHTEDVVAAYVYLPPDRYPNGESQISFYDGLQTRLEGVPGVESVAIGIAPTEASGRVEYELADAPPIDERNRSVTLATVVSPGYFQTMGATVLSGREVNDFDRATSLPVVLVNERFASRNWPRESPLGKHLRLIRDGKPDAWLTVVGMVSNIVQNDPTRQQFDPIVYLPFRQSPAPGIGLVARTRVPPQALFTAFQRELHAVDGEMPFQHLVPLTAWMARVGGIYELNRNIAILFVVFGATALLLASVGLYAVIAHSVTQRHQEIGIRSALGASARDLRNLVFRQGMRPLGTGLIIGMAASFGVNRLLQAELVRVSPADPFALVVASAVLVLSGVLGCWIPARHAAKVDPLVALKHQ